MAYSNIVRMAMHGLAFSFAFDTSENWQVYEQTALLQGHISRKYEAGVSHASHAFFPKLAHLNDPHTRKAALLEMKKTAVELASMDRTQATDIVIRVCTETAELLNVTVLSSIIQEDAADRASLAAAYEGFAHWEVQRQEAEDQLNAAEAIVTERGHALTSCRETESESCVNETICNTIIEHDCSERDRLEEELRQIDEEIHEQWCEDGAVRTHTEFRSTTVSVFHRYTEKWNELHELVVEQGLCDRAIEHCENATQRYIDQAIDCNNKEAELQMGFCEYHHVASIALAAYQQGFLATLALYNDIVARVMIQEVDRKMEWDVLTRVICLLLTLTNQENGVVSSAEIAERIERCWEDPVDVSHLDIDYRDPPVMLTLPELPPLPCEVNHIGGVALGPPAECLELMNLHHTESTHECSCLADEITEQALNLGHYLLIDPAVSIQVHIGNSEWTINLDGTSYAGPMSEALSQDFSILSSEMLTSSEMDPNSDDYTGPITSIAWAYPSPRAVFGESRSLGQRFTTNGGLVFLNAEGEVIRVRDLTPSSGPLGQPVATTLEFSSAQRIRADQAAAACPAMVDVPPNSMDYSQGARQYCWVMGGEILNQCVNGCFVYSMTYGKVVFPLMEGLQITQSRYGGFLEGWSLS